MKFKSLSAGALLVGAIAASACFSAPAQAAALAPGSFRLVSDNPALTNVSTSGGITSFTLNFVDNAVDSDPFALHGVFTSLTAGIGGPTIQPLAFSGPSAGNTFSNAGQSSFIRNIFLGADEVFVDLNPFSVTNTTGEPLSSTLFNLTGGFTGTVRDSLGNVLGLGNLSALRVGSGSDEAEIDVATTAVPTPALLPGLIGMGMAVIRKRKAEAAMPDEAEV